VDRTVSGATLPAGSRVSELALTVSDLDRSVSFYERVLGLEVVAREPDEVDMGTGGVTIVRLFHDPRAQAVRGTAKLYHFAILFPSRADLARALLRLLATRWPLDGASDHLVSEAIYLADPERNGIELYRDRPREEWPITDGKIQMATLPLDLQRLVADAGGDGAAGAPAGTTLGHIHLHVNDLAAAERFYREVVGLEVMARYGDSASFLAAGGYHHHVAVNIWGTEGAAPAVEGGLGLRWYRLALPSSAALQALDARLDESGVEYTKESGATRFRDPAGHTIIASTATSHVLGRE
jgi:catechol 2,3-dioxygenase